MTAKNVAKGHAAQEAQLQKIKKARLWFLWLLLPKIPRFLRVFIFRLLGMSDTARYIDLSTDLTLTALRAMFDPQTLRPIGETQALSMLDSGVKGRMWVSNAVAEAPPQKGLREVLLDVIVSMGNLTTREAELVKIPPIAPVEAEWTGYRAGVARDAPLPLMSEVVKYEAMMKECKNGTTVLYFHGGAYYLCDPSSHRELAKRLAKNTGGRVYSVRYRLAPQHPFPAALLDALVSYLTLLYPPPGSVHEPVPAKNIIFGGDSAGGNLALALTQTLLHLRRSGTKVTWFGQEHELPLPAGLTLLSPWVDVLHSMPSWTTNQKWDYLPSPELLDLERVAPPADSVWPATPPRKRIFVDDALALHPLVCAQLARSWEGAPPFWISCGWECLADEDKYLVSRLRADGVPVVFEEYEAMPHVFTVVLPRLRESERCLQGAARFIASARKEPASIASSYTYIQARTLKERGRDMDMLTPFRERDVFEMAYAQVGEKAPALALGSSRL
ncbi:alpha/beta hydrolase fold-domain-containing protein [Xylaria nigripes]|nr:alpha/beta hydrolase fold-domain-containing protein [Xylaria nigripes]